MTYPAGVYVADIDGYWHRGQARGPAWSASSGWGPYGALGSYKPDDDHSGLLAGWDAPSLTPYTGSYTITTPNQTFANMKFTNKVSVAAANVTFRNCLFQGINSWGTSAYGLLTCTAGSDGTVAEDCDFIPQHPSEWANGIIGHDFTLRRCRVLNSSDCINTFNTAAFGTPLNVTLEAVYTDKMMFVRPTTETPPRPEGTHNDCLQTNSGGNVRAEGCNLQGYFNPDIGDAGFPDDGTHGNRFYPVMTANACVMINQGYANTGPGGITIINNWLGGGAVGINMAEQGRGPIPGLVIENNRFDHGQLIGTQALIPRATYDISTLSGNVFEDGVGTPYLQRT